MLWVIGAVALVALLYVAIAQGVNGSEGGGWNDGWLWPLVFVIPASVGGVLYGIAYAVYRAVWYATG